MAKEFRALLQVGTLLVWFSSGQSQSTPSSGLYFMLNDTIFLPGDSVYISDIGLQPNNRSDAASTLICVTSNVNTQCCRSSDGGAYGDFYYPNNSVVLRRSVVPQNTTNILIGYVYTHQIRLGSVGSPTEPLGNYTCIVTNGTGVNISATINIISAVTSVVISPSNPSGTAGEPITLTCTATIPGTGTPIFTWSGPSSLSQGPTAGQGSGNTYTNTLTFAKVAQSLEGTYTCQVQLGNSVGMDSEMLSVTVPTISATLRQSGTPIALRTYILTCEISAPSSLELLPLSYTWTRNSFTITYEQSNTLDLGPLQLSENGAMYTCQYTASSIYLNGNVNRMSGTLTLSITVLPPYVPTNVNAVLQTTSVTLTWTQSLLDVITDYMISYNITAGCSDALSGSTTASGSPYTITGLQEFIEYQITVRARNSAGTSTAAMTRVTTLSSVPTGSPTLMLQSVSTTGFTVIWEREPCLSRNGRDVNYVIRLRLSGTNNILESESVSVNNRIFTANSLNPGSVYTFEVAFVNQLGTGPYAALNITTFNLPCPPSSGLYFMLNNVTYLPGDSVRISDIGLQPNNRFDAASTLVCVTTNVNTQCCRSSDGDTIANFYYPNNTIVLRRNEVPESYTDILIGYRQIQQIRLGSVGSPTGPLGSYTCVVPDENGVNVSAIINIIAGTSVSPLTASSNLPIMSSLPLTTSLLQATSILLASISDPPSTTFYLLETTSSLPLTSSLYSATSIYIPVASSIQPVTASFPSVTTSSPPATTFPSSVTIFPTPLASPPVLTSSFLEITATPLPATPPVLTSSFLEIIATPLPATPPPATISSPTVLTSSFFQITSPLPTSPPPATISSPTTKSVQVTTSPETTIPITSPSETTFNPTIETDPVTYATPSVNIIPSSVTAEVASMLILNCTSDVVGNFTWTSISGNSLKSNSAIAFVNEIESSFSILRVSSVEVSHAGTYMCEVTRNGVVGISTATITVKVRPPIIANITSSPHIIYDGMTFTLTCNIDLLEELSSNLSLQVNWIAPIGPILTISLLHPGISYNSSITITNPDTSDNGNYTCSANIISSIPILLSSEIVTDVFLLSLVPQPLIQARIQGFPIDNNFFTGLQLNLTSFINILQVSPDHIKTIAIVAEWKNSGKVVQSNRHVTVLEPYWITMFQYQTSLLFNSLEKPRDEGMYTCKLLVIIERIGADAFSWETTLAHSLEIPTVFFQIRITGNVDCEEWKVINPLSKDADIMNAIRAVMLASCNCDFTTDRLTSQLFLCNPTRPQSVSYQAEMQGTLETNTSQLIAILEKWISSTTVYITVQLSLLRVDNFCIVPSDSQQPCNEQVSSTPSISGQVNVGAIAAGVIIGLIILISVIASLIIVSYICWRRRKYNYKFTSDIVVSNNDLNHQYSSKSGDNGEYEEIRDYRTSTFISIHENQTIQSVKNPAYIDSSIEDRYNTLTASGYVDVGHKKR